MFLTRTAIASFVLFAGSSSAFAPMQRPAAHGFATVAFRMTAEGEAEAPPTPPPAPVAVAEATKEESKTDESKVDVSVPYDATVEMAYEASDKEKSFEDFKVEYLAKSVAEVIAKQKDSGDDEEGAKEETAEEIVSVEETEEVKEEVEEEVEEEEYKLRGEGVVYYKRPTVAADQIYLGKTKSKGKEVTPPKPQEVKKEAKKEEVVKAEVEVIKKRGEGATYYQRPTLTQKQIYAWDVKTPKEASIDLEARRERQGKFTLKKNEEKAIFVKNLDRSVKKEKPKKKKVVKKTGAEKKAIRKENLKARAKTFVLEKNKAKAALLKEKVESKPKVESKKKKQQKAKPKPAKVQVTSKKTDESKTTTKKESTKKEPKNVTGTFADEAKKQQTSIEDVKNRTEELLKASSEGKVETTAADSSKKDTKVKGGFFSNLFSKKDATKSTTKETSIDDIKKQTAELLEK